MKNSNLFRFLLLLLAFSTVLVCFVGCNDNSKKPDDTTESQEETTDPNNGTTDPNTPTLDIPANLNYGNAPITVLAWNSIRTDFSHQVEEMNGVPLDEAILERDANLSERVGIILDYTPIAGGHNQVSPFKSFVQQAHEGGTPYDIVASYTRCNAVCASAGFFLDINSIKDSYLDMDKPWWNDDIVEKTSVNDSYFMITGDASASLVQLIYCIYFNADLLLDYGLESPYDLVADNKWTYDKMFEMGLNFYQDINEDNKKDLGDMYPLLGNYCDWPALFHGCEINYATKDDDGNIIVDPILVDEKAIDLYEYVYDAVWLDNSYVARDEDLLSNFLAQKSLFWIVNSGCANDNFSEVTFEYGCVPIPKYNSKQEEYHCAVCQPISLFSMMRGVESERHQMITAVLETWAYESYTETTPVIFEQIMQYQRSTSPEMTEMLGLIRDSGYFDFIRIYTVDYPNGVGGCDFIGNFLREKKSWNEVTKIGGMYKSWCASNDILIETFREIVES